MSEEEPTELARLMPRCDYDQRDRPSGDCMANTQARVTHAETKFSKALSKELDHIIGVRGQTNFNLWLFLTMRFENSSNFADITVEGSASGAFGPNFIRNVCLRERLTLFCHGSRKDCLIYDAAEIWTFQGIGGNCEKGSTKQCFRQSAKDEPGLNVMTAKETPSTHPNIHPIMKMFHLATALTASYAFAVLAPVMVRAEEASPSSAAATSRVDPQALEVLRRMSTTLGAAKAFTYRSTNVVEVPAKTGQFITLFSTAEVALKRPDKLRARLTGEAPHFNFYFDGKTASAFAPATKVYSTLEALSTIDTMLPAMQEETGIRFASAPLLFSDSYSVLTRELRSGVVVGATTVNGRPCQHLAFRSPGVNWEIWIESGQRALPWRLAVTFTDRTNFPRVLVEFLNWNLHPWLKASDFAFRRPAGAREIPFLSVIKPERPLIRGNQ